MLTKFFTRKKPNSFILQTRPIMLQIMGVETVNQALSFLEIAPKREIEKYTKILQQIRELVTIQKRLKPRKRTESNCMLQ